VRKSAGIGAPRMAGVASLATVLVLAACAGTIDSPAPIVTTPEATPMEDAWIALFDGSSTAALRGYGEEAFPTSWVVEDGELHALPGSGVDLITRDTFGDFELEFDWRVSPGGNSGILYRVVEGEGPSWTSGPEYQVLDDALHPDAQDPRTAAAALYGLIAPNADKRLKPVGAFNAGRIVVSGGRVEHWLDGSPVVTYEWQGSDVRSLVEASKFRGTPGFMSADAGAVVIQHHGEEVWFRNIRIRPLD
jgi:hypothetical protein